MAIFFFSPPGDKALTAPSTGQEGDSQHPKTPACRAGAPHSLSLGSGPCTSSPGGWMKRGCDAKRQPTSCRGDGTRGHRVPSSQSREVRG